MGPTTAPPPAQQMPLEPNPFLQPEPRGSVTPGKALPILLVAAVPVALAVALLLGLLLVRGENVVEGPIEATGGSDDDVSVAPADEIFTVVPAAITPAEFLKSDEGTALGDGTIAGGLEMLTEVEFGSETFRTFYVETIAADSTSQLCFGLSGYGGSEMQCGTDNPFDFEIGATGPPTEPAVFDVTHLSEGVTTLVAVVPPGEELAFMQVTAENGWTTQANFSGDPAVHQSAIVAWDASFGPNSVVTFYTADGRQVWSNR